MRLYVLGAGMAGLLTANILRHLSPVILEAQTNLPDNHGALLRFRSDMVARVTGQRFQKVRVRKAVKLDGKLHTVADLRMSNMYAYKVGGEVMDRSILDLSPVERYVAPPNFLSAMTTGLDIRLDNAITPGWIHAHCEVGLVSDRTPIISTIPMPVMMDLVGWTDRPEFRWREIWSITARILRPRTEVYQTIYYPHPYEKGYYRASITGDLLTVECISNPQGSANEDLIAEILNDFGIFVEGEGDLSPIVVKNQKYGKLLPIDDSIRKAFIFGLSNEYGIYSVGRFATWRQILLDDIVQDVNKVHDFILDKDQYSQHLQT